MKSNLTPRALGALVTAGLSLFLLLCFAGYTQADVDSVQGPKGLADTVAAAFVGPLGAGAHVIALLGLAWGVIVYFQERTPDLVLRLVGTTALAASTAMLMGLLHGGKASVWAGTVGEAGARMMIGMGTAGTVLGWVVVLALAGASMIFATDSFFNTLRRSGRPAYDPALMPVEPSRGDLLESPAEAEPRVFVRAESRAAVAVERLATAEALPLEVRPESLPQGFSAAETSAGTVVRGPQGYEGVEFLSMSDELALPETRAAAPSFERHFEDMVDDQFDYGSTHHDAVALAGAGSAGFLEDDLGGGLPPAPDSTFAVAHADEAPTQEAPTAASEPVSSGRASEFPAEPEHGIALADASLLVDEVFSFPAAGFVEMPSMPHDGASAASEIASSYAIADPVAVESAAHESLAPAAARPQDESPESAGQPSADVAVPAFFEDDVVIGGGPVFGDDVLYVYEGASDFEPQPDSFPASVAIAVAAGPERAVAVAVPTAAAPEATHAEIGIAAPRQLEIFEQATAPDAMTISQAIVAVVGDLAKPSTEDAAIAADVAVESAAEPTVVAPPASDPVATPSVEATRVATPIAAATDAAIEEIAPVSPPVPAPAGPVAEPVLTVAQLALFPTTQCDLGKLRTMELDPLFLDAAEAVLARGRASAVVLQRALGISYARGLRILDQMTEAGMLGPDSPGGSREVFFTREAWTAFLAGA